MSTSAEPRGAKVTHPLEVIPFFRRYRPSQARNVLYTLIWNSLIALTVTVLITAFSERAGFGRFLWANWLISNCIGFLIHLEYVVGHRLLGEWLARRPGAVQVTYYMGIPVLGVFGGYWLALEILALPATQQAVFSPRGIFLTLFFTVVVSAVIAAFFSSREKAAQLEANYLREQSRAAIAAREAADARLRLLQAQIEPHFLFNTLANVVSLIDPAPAKAKLMLEDFIDFLRASLAATRAGRLDLGREIDLLHSYLRLIEQRMGGRLRYSFDIAAAARDLPFPPLLLQPIVENAIKHGLEPKIEGGEIRISAALVAERLRIDVADTGLGLAEPIAEGVGLANIRERLHALYGAAATLAIANESSGSRSGARVTLEIPLARIFHEDCG